jgi:predicted dehydrogenase
MSGTVNIGIIGAGFGQQVHVPAFRKVPGCKVYAICASRLERARSAAQKFEISLSTSNWREVIADANIHAVSLAVPPPLQAEIALAAVKAGKHIFCEKPLALNADQGREIVEAAAQAGVVHAIDFIFPEIAAWQKAREIIQGSALVRIRHIALTWRVETYSYGAGARSLNWKKRAAEGGGTLNNFVSHTVYYLEWLFGRINKVAARFGPRETEVEARVDSWVEFAAGFHGTVSVAADSFLGPGHRLEVYGDNGTLVLDNPTSDYARGFRLSTATRPGKELSPVPVSGDDDQPDGRIYPVSQIAGRFIASIRSGGSLTPNLKDGLRAQVLLDALRLAARNGSWQALRS